MIVVVKTHDGVEVATGVTSIIHPSKPDTQEVILLPND